MQQPTLKGVRIRSTRDALQVFYGVATRLLPLITRRLDAEERRAIIPGNVYVWEERGANTEPTGLGMERWTDGMGWGPSRVRDEFLFYHQKESDLSDELVHPVTPWAQMMRRREQSVSQLSSSGYHPSQPPESERLVKQTYSVHVSLPADRPRGITRKWHLTAYFSQKRLDALETIDSIRGIGDVPVPDGWFKSARAGKTGRGVRSGKNPQPSPEDVAHPTAANIRRLSQSSLGSLRDSSSSIHHISESYTDTSDSPSTMSPSSTSPSYSPTRPDQLVPLEYLQNISGSRRNPTDEQLLSRFSSQTLASGGTLRPPPRPL